ncbi:unnamed protein product [Diatraea saccharalis]|uniref:Uncharacterized protein n=1 Tax=Diatraea saccharalis TaxID=40085 RepID=A0A9N9RAH7_9NEOP|nr:unnamed protein product [Diatraea saccharalis]
MDDTHQSRPSDAASAATRKRRSSILKSQRPPRTPFSELEFHVATPTDTAKSRRVSFSRRTGVAEFVTNEATTTWKNFYEEHNKSLELSGNDSVANPPKQTIGHLGKRIFDQQFQEVEAVDFTSLDNPSRTINTSLNKVNFTEQLASLECTSGDKTLLAPQQNFEMSSFTDQQTNVFGENFVVSTMGEESGGININFSAIQTIGSSEVVDDLDQMQADLLRVKSNIFCPGPFTGRADLSEYIEVDLNTTHVTMKNDVSDMSITDTIHSPKVQEVSKNNSIKINRSQYKDLVADKENIVIFDMGCSPVNTTEKRKTIVYENENVSITQGLPMNIILPKDNKSEKRRTIVYESDAADISVTQAVPDNIMLDDTNKRKTILSHNETGNISITQALPMNIILPKENKSEKRRTIVYENDAADISVTQAVPDNIIS